MLQRELFGLASFDADVPSSESNNSLAMTTWFDHSLYLELPKAEFEGKRKVTIIVVSTDTNLTFRSTGIKAGRSSREVTVSGDQASSLAI